MNLPTIKTSVTLSHESRVAAICLTLLRTLYIGDARRVVKMLAVAFEG